MKDLMGKLGRVKWNLVIMAAFCLLYAAYIYVTPATGGEGTFMITPEEGLPGILAQLPWIGIFLGATGLIASFASTSGWVLSWTEPALAAVMFVAGFWELFFPYDIRVFSQTFAFIGIFLAFYVMFVSFEMERTGRGNWLVALALAAATWIVSFVNIMDFAGHAAAQGLASLTLYLAAFGFAYGAVSLSGVGSIEESIGAPRRFFASRRAAKAEAAV
ncbi:MAG: hypothetical protein E7001_04495 [Coriobacteriaceae bacterium]|nr:hypothetical protein [Coriobacteriaceae bacterium]